MNIENVYGLSMAANIYLFKVNNGNTRTMLEISSKWTIKKPEKGLELFLTLNT